MRHLDWFFSRSFLNPSFLRFSWEIKSVGGRRSGSRDSVQKSAKSAHGNAEDAKSAIRDKPEFA